jgi:hypothetical protein
MRESRIEDSYTYIQGNLDILYAHAYVWVATIQKARVCNTWVGELCYLSACVDCSVWVHAIEIERGWSNLEIILTSRADIHQMGRCYHERRVLLAVKRGIEWLSLKLPMRMKFLTVP